MLAWFTQLGMGVIASVVGFPLLALWLKNRFGWGDWTVILGCVLGVISAADSARKTIRIMRREAERDAREGKKPSGDPGGSY